MEKNDSRWGNIGCLVIILVSVFWGVFMVLDNLESRRRKQYFDVAQEELNAQSVEPALMPAAFVSAPSDTSSHLIREKYEAYETLKEIQQTDRRASSEDLLIWARHNNYFTARTPDEAYDEGYEYGYEQGLQDGSDGEDENYGYDDGCDYHGNMRQQYELGYEDGYYEGYEEGHEEYINSRGD